MHTHTVECYEVAFQSSPLLYTGENAANQRLVLCISVQLRSELRIV